MKATYQHNLVNTRARKRDQKGMKCTKPGLETIIRDVERRKETRCHSMKRSSLNNPHQTEGTKFVNVLFRTSGDFSITGLIIKPLPPIQ